MRAHFYVDVKVMTLKVLDMQMALQVENKTGMVSVESLVKGSI